MLTIPNIEQIVVRDDDILGGIPVFVGTRVPVQTLLDISKRANRSMNSWTTSRLSAKSRQRSCSNR